MVARWFTAAGVIVNRGIHCLMKVNRIHPICRCGWSGCGPIVCDRSVRWFRVSGFIGHDSSGCGPSRRGPSRCCFSRHICPICECRTSRIDPLT